ncbi:uncharacterized protein LOC134260970 [Saccostrea cucullata]|uniref:uncharacterized protein LOC134260970 n=1 Tax=Saccostrea cuccullata TaxID=36930 RepID=UPI002ED63A95
MAAFSYASTEETTNACRACRLLLGPCTDELRDVLSHYVPPSTFPYVIKQKISNLPRLTAPQMNLILPRGSSYTGNYSEMDIPLLYTLLRNICSIPPHSNGWGNDPDPTDRSLSANIERIRIARNQCVHSSSPILSNADFNTIWSTVRSAVVDFDSFLNNGNRFEREVDFLRLETMDPVRDLRFIEELRKQAEEDAATRKIIDGVKVKLSQMKDELVSRNVKAIHENDVLQWEDDDKIFHECHNFSTMLDKVKNQTHVTFVGVPGSGKTATARHIALMLQQEGYEIVPIDEIREIKQYCDLKNPQVFVIDDVVGVFGLQETKSDLLFLYQNRIMDPPMPKSKTLMTCREAVYREAIKTHSFFTENNIVWLHSEANALSHTDKINILKMYNIEVDLLSPINLKSASKMFPYLCKIYSTDKKIQVYGPAFFENPIPCILEELNEMEKQNKIHYVSLVLCMMNENRISEEILENTENEAVTQNLKEIKDKVLKECRVSRYTDIFKIVDALKEMMGTYTKLCGSEYSFLHDSMFEIVAFHFGRQFPELILQFMSSNFIFNSVKLQECQISEKHEDMRKGKEEEENEQGESFDLSIMLGRDKYPALARRLYKDIEKRDLHDVFKSQFLKQPNMLKAFTEVLNEKPFIEMASLFLSKQKALSEERDEEQNYACGLDFMNTDKWRKWRLLGFKGFVRAICWLIYYGHHQLLQYIIERSELHEEKKSDINIKDCINPALRNYTAGMANIQLSGQRRLLVLSCYSGDLDTVRFLLKYFQRNKSNKNLKCLGYDHMAEATPLKAACMTGHVSIVKLLIEAGANVNLPGYDRPMLAACEYGHLRVVNELINAGAAINPKGYYLIDSPLMAACRNGHLRVVRKLIEAGADVNLQNNYSIPISAACENGHLSVVKELIKAGAAVNPQNAYGYHIAKPLIAACENGHLGVVKVLIEAGADVNLQSNDHNTPMIAACENEQLSVVKVLIEAGADVNLQINNNTPLIAACKNGHSSVVKELIKAGIDVNLQTEYGTILMAACKNGHLSIVKVLIEAGADVNLQGEDDTPLINACEEGHLNVVKELIEAGADVNLQGKYSTPLVAACANGHSNVIKELIEAGTNVNLHTSKSTPLLAACRNRHFSLVKQLIEAGADVNLQSKYDAPLGAACENWHLGGIRITIEEDSEINMRYLHDSPQEVWQSEHLNAVKELLEAGACVNSQDILGRTPLYRVVLDHTKNVTQAVHILSMFGADSSIRNKDGYSALYITLFKNKTDVVKQLFQTEKGNNLNRLKLHLFDCLVDIRHSDVGTDFKDDVVVTQRRVWCMQEFGELYNTIKGCKCDGLKHLLKVGLDINQWIQVYSDKPNFDMMPLLFILINGFGVEDRVKKIRILLQAGANVNDRVKFSRNHFVLDRDSVFDDLIDDDDDEGEGERLVFDSENVYDIYPTDDEGEDSVLDNEIASDNHSTDEEGEGSGLDSEIASDNHSTDEEGEGSGLDSENASDNHSTDEFNDQEKKEVISMLDREGVSVLERTRRLMIRFREPMYKMVLMEVKKYARRYSL